MPNCISQQVVRDSEQPQMTKTVTKLIQKLAFLNLKYFEGRTYSNRANLFFGTYNNFIKIASDYFSSFFLQVNFDKTYALLVRLNEWYNTAWISNIRLVIPAIV